MLRENNMVFNTKEIMKKKNMKRVFLSETKMFLISIFFRSKLVMLCHKSKKSLTIIDCKNKLLLIINQISFLIFTTILGFFL